MPAYKDKERNTWYITFYYKNWLGENKKKCKRGFKTKKDALEWELTFRQREASSLDMSFKDFVKLYSEDIRPRLKYNTWLTKEHIIETKLIPYFGGKQMNQIKPSDIIKWQNEMITLKDKNGELYSQAYLRTIQAQLSAIFNHAGRLYELKSNPVRRAGSIGGKSTTETKIWTRQEYKKFSDAVSDKPQSFYAFEVLYWAGLRIGELLALTPADIDTKTNIISITKSLQRIHGEMYITSPKTAKSVRKVQIPEFLSKELEEFEGLMYGLTEENRLFQISKGYLHHEMDRGSQLAGVERIRVHDLRHSHVSLLIEMGFTPVDIANRMGHENINITMHYAHMFPTKQNEIASKLNAVNGFGEAM